MVHDEIVLNDLRPYLDKNLLVDNRVDAENFEYASHHRYPNIHHRIDIYSSKLKKRINEVTF